jgi:hypothetical protein
LSPDPRRPSNVAVTCICAVDGLVHMRKIGVAMQAWVCSGMSVLSLGKLPWGVGWARCGGHELERRITIRIREPGRHPCTYLYPVLPRKDPDLPDDPCCSGRAGSPWPCNGCQPAGLRPCCSFLRLTLHLPVQPPPDHRMRRPSVMPIRMRVTSFAEPAVSSITGWRTHSLSPHGGLNVASSLPT